MDLSSVTLGGQVAHIFPSPRTCFLPPTIRTSTDVGLIRTEISIANLRGPMMRKKIPTRERKRQSSPNQNDERKERHQKGLFTLSSQLFRFDVNQGITMKFSSIALSALLFAAKADAFTGPQMKPRFGLQVRYQKLTSSCFLDNEKDTASLLRGSPVRAAYSRFSPLSSV